LPNRRPERGKEGEGKNLGKRFLKKGRGFIGPNLTRKVLRRRLNG